MSELQEKYKYNPFTKYSNELESVIFEKGYNENIANMIRLSFPIMIEHYGHEYKDTLLDVLKDVDIVIPEDGETMYDVVQKYTPKNIEHRSQVSAVNNGELKKAAGVYHSAPILEIKDGKVVLIGKSEFIGIAEISDKLEQLATFVHENGHGFKSNKNSMNLLEDENGNQILITRNGISVTYSKVYIENGIIVVEDIQENNIGLEEGINTYDENCIMNRILSLPINEIPENCQQLRNSLILPDSETEYSSSGYVQETLCADKLITKCKLASNIRQDQFIGTSTCELKYDSIAKNPENTWKVLNSRIDKSVKDTYARYQHIFEPNWFEEHKSEIIGNLQNIHTMLDETSQCQNTSILQNSLNE